MALLLLYLLPSLLSRCCSYHAVAVDGHANVAGLDVIFTQLLVAVPNNAALLLSEYVVEVVAVVG